MRLSELKQIMQQAGKLDFRGLICYATLAGTVNGQAFQNLVAAVFSASALDLYHANIDGSVGDMLVSIPYETIQDFQLKHRFWYSNTAFTAPSGSYRFYSYDKKLFLQGFREAGLLEN